MTVEALLKQLKDERESAMRSVWMYGSRALEARRYGYYDDEEYYDRIHDEHQKEAERLSMIIKEIEKRVS